MRTMSTRFLLCLPAVFVLLGCDSPGWKAKAPPKAPLAQAPIGTGTGEATTTGAAWDPSKQVPVVFTQGLAVSDAIAAACGIAPRNDGRMVAPAFDYDSAALDQQDRELLAQIAKCLTDGPLKGRSVALIGRADPRGEQEYNMTLGVSRADAVKRYMVDLGVGRDRMRATSRGELDATGTSEEGWAKDRRVDVELAL
jgi:peptidoglycan-associated lipoprotein